MIPTDEQLKELRAEILVWVERLPGNYSALGDLLGGVAALDEGSWRVFVMLMVHLILNKGLGNEVEVSKVPTQELLTEVGRRMSALEKKQ